MTTGGWEVCDVLIFFVFFVCLFVCFVVFFVIVVCFY